MNEHPALIDKWHRAIAAQDVGAVTALLAEDSVFLSPAVHTPQRGKPLVAKYLGAAMHILNNEHFRYLGQWFAPHSAVLEFETKIGDIYVNGIDMITWNEADLITSFKVMIRPLKGLNTVVPLMIEQLTGKAP